MRKGVANAECVQGGRSDLVDARVLRPADVSWQHHHPLNPWGAQDLKWRRDVVGDGGPQRLTVDGDAVVGVLVAGQELLEQRGESARGGIARNHSRSADGWSSRKVACAPAPPSAEGKPTSSANATASMGVRTS